jgi:hypothetical protein
MQNITQTNNLDNILESIQTKDEVEKSKLRSVKEILEDVKLGKISKEEAKEILHLENQFH